MVKRLPIFLLCVAFLAGCGPTPQERYDTALNILEKEQRQLALLRPNFDEAVALAIDDVCRESLGFSQWEIKTEIEKAKYDDENHRTDVKKLMGQLDQVHKVSMLIFKHGTKEEKRFNEIVGEFRGHKEYSTQLDRVRRAQEEVDAAEADRQ